MARLIALLLLVSPVYAADYAAPDLQSYYASLMMPDQPHRSCCGEADAWFADKTEIDPVTGGLIAVITDTRPDLRTLPDGRTINRIHIPPGTKFLVPPSKIRRHPIPNPTGHTIIFIGARMDVLCYEPQPLI